VCDPDDIRSQKSTSDSAAPLVSYRSGTVQIARLLQPAQLAVRYSA
jgi:hypothetical protein